MSGHDPFELPKDFINEILKQVYESSSPRSVMIPDQSHLVQQIANKFLRPVLHIIMIMTGYVQTMTIRKSEVDYALNMFVKENTQSLIIQDCLEVDTEEENDYDFEPDCSFDVHAIDMDHVSTCDESEQNSREANYDFDQIYPPVVKPIWTNEKVFQRIIRPMALEMNHSDLRWRRDAITRMNLAMQSYLSYKLKNASNG